MAAFIIGSHWREAEERSSNQLLDKTHRSNDWLLDEVALSLSYQLVIKTDTPTTIIENIVIYWI